MAQLQTRILQIAIEQDVQVRQKVGGLEMLAHHGAQLGRDILGLAHDAAHTANQALLTDRDAQAVRPLACSLG